MFQRHPESRAWRVRSCIASMWVCGSVALGGSFLDHPIPDRDGMIPVQLDLTADDSLRSVVETCLIKELEAIPDVRLEETAPVILRVIAIEQRSTAGESLGHLVYVAGLLRVPSEQMDAVFVKWERLRALPPNSSRLCQLVRTDFDEQILQFIRGWTRDTPENDPAAGEDGGE